MCINSCCFVSGQSQLQGMLRAHYGEERNFNILSADRALDFLEGEAHGDLQCASQQAALINHFAAQGPVVIFHESEPRWKRVEVPSMSAFTYLAESTYRANMYVYGWDDPESMQACAHVDVASKKAEMEAERVSACREDARRNLEIGEVAKRIETFRLVEGENLRSEAVLLKYRWQTQWKLFQIERDEMASKYTLSKMDFMNCAWTEQTFLDRTRSLVKVLEGVNLLREEPRFKNVKMFFLAGAHHLKTPTGYSQNANFNLDALYSELTKHRATVLIPQHIMKNDYNFMADLCRIIEDNDMKMLHLYLQHCEDQLTQKELDEIFAGMATRGYNESFKLFLEREDFTQGDFGPPLINAAKNGHGEIVHALLSRVPPLTFSEGACDQALEKSAEEGYTEIVRELMQYSDKLSQACFDQALLNAARAGHRDIIQLLIGSPLFSQAHDFENVVRALWSKGYFELAQKVIAQVPENNFRFRLQAVSLALQYCVKEAEEVADQIGDAQARSSALESLGTILCERHVFAGATRIAAKMSEGPEKAAALSLIAQGADVEQQLLQHLCGI